MKRHKILSIRTGKQIALFSAIICTFIHPLHAADTQAPARAHTLKLSSPASQKGIVSPADRAWQTLKHDYETPPKPLKQLPDRMYTQKEIQDYYLSVADKAAAVADEAKRFYTHYPKHPQAAKAKDIYFDMLHVSVASSGKKKIAELETVTAERIKNPKLDDNARFQLALRLLRSAVSGRQYESDDAMRGELEKRAGKLAKDYPNHPEGCNYLVGLARVANPVKSATIAKEVLTLSKDVKIKTECRGIITRAKAIDKPLSLTLTANGGKTLDLNKLRGKVVLLLFWDSSSHFSPKAIYVVNEMYKKYNDKGLEFIGLSFDSDQTKAAATIKQYDLKWPQYQDAASGWKVRSRFGVETLPLCWFVDKKGVLRELHGERDPSGIADKLLAE